jgi:hypothetical protein
MRRLLLGTLLLSLACVSPGVAQIEITQVTLMGNDGNLYGAGGNQFYLYSPTTGGTTVLNNNASALKLCLERSDGTLLGINLAPTSQPELVKVTLAGQITALAQFPGIDDGPICPSIANDGNYYGSAVAGGNYNRGYFYQLTAAGQLNIFYSFTGESDGSGPFVSPIQASTGDLYYYSGTNLLRYSPTTGLAVYPTGVSLLGNYETLLEGPDGNFYVIPYETYVLQIQPTGAAAAIYTPSLDGEGNPADLTNLYLTGTDSYPLAALQQYRYTSSSEYDGCSAHGNYFSLAPLSLTGASSGALFSIGYDESNQGYADADDYTPSLVFGGNGTFYGALQDDNYTDDGEGDCTASILTSNVSYPTTATPITMSLSQTHVLPKGSAKLNWSVNDAFSDTMKQCFGFGGLSGPVALSGSTTVTAPSAGSYVTSIVCGGTETGLATLVAGNAALSLSASATQVVIGSPVTLTATVTNSATPAPTGKVNFLVGTTVIGSANLGNFLVMGAATLTASTTDVAPGTYLVTSSYVGDGNYGAAKSSDVSITVVARKATTLALTPASRTVLQGATATFTATVTGSSPYGYPSGTVKFLLGTTVLATETLTKNGTYTSYATLSEATTGLTAGTYQITASYSGDTYNLPSMSSSTVTISSNTPVTLAVSPNPVPAGDSFTLTATVQGKDNPTGTVIFYVGGMQQLASTSVGSGGVAKVTLPAGTLAAGSYQLTAHYAGDTNNPSGTSPTVTLTIQ